MQRLKKQILIGLLVLPYFSAVIAQTSLQNRIDRLLGNEFYQTASIGISVYDLTDNKPLYQFNERKLCRPASNMKLLTTATALQYLTSSYEFRTRLFYTGSIDSTGCLYGDLYLAGGFDPEFRSSDLDTMVYLMKKSGIQRFEGRIFADVSMADSVYWGKAWSWDDDMEAFQPYLSPLPVNKNVVKVRIIPATPSRAPVIRTEPASAFISIENNAVTAWKSSEPVKKTLNFHRTCDGFTNRIVISGNIPASVPFYETMISLKNPNNYVLTLFSEKIAEQLPGSDLLYGGLSKTPLQAKTLGYTRHSISEVIRQLNKESDNLNAEMLLYALGLQCCNAPSSTEKGIEMMQQMITSLGFDPKKYSIVDGSGLSNQNYLTPELMVAILKYIYASENYPVFKSSLPEAGIDGTLAHRMKATAAYRKVFAKTGSLTGVNTISGYVHANNGHILAFSIMIQNFTEKTSYVSVHYVDKLCEALVK
ncbi:MAG: D-alanyl-D-alanine carboxypeptidase/D-alanyl-D-alanine-endopeptidase [Bacteroidales bacterium]|jgi:D-alanyl-D-alanine carboxypeptidase/D-alanyl-D-alanine-endopeptidase (penicillin-binding protein 4)|nr:D-alanyl-D-alanine carboxypeptidase/D-alanyl-D-alanine-endopeptidase [Bacteroidales bacterium]